MNGHLEQGGRLPEAPRTARDIRRRRLIGVAKCIAGFLVSSVGYASANAGSVFISAILLPIGATLTGVGVYEIATGEHKKIFTLKSS